MRDKTCWVYGLVDPRNGQVRYVGLSRDPASRLYQHIKNYKYSYLRETPKTRWLDELKQLGLSPLLQIIEQVNGGAGDRERYWISAYNKQVPLLNIKPGGGNKFTN